MQTCWTPEKIRSLRHRSGWSQAELSRRVGVRLELVRSWERGEKTPGGEASSQLAALEESVRRYSQAIAADPVAERFLEKNRLNQVLKSDLKNQ